MSSSLPPLSLIARILLGQTHFPTRGSQAPLIHDVFLSKHLFSEMNPALGTSEKIQENHTIGISFLWRSHFNWRRIERIHVFWKSHYSEPNMLFFLSYLCLIICRGSFTQIPNAQSCCWYLNLKSTSRVTSSLLSLMLRTSNCPLTTSQMISCYPGTIYRLISRMRNSFAVIQVALKVLIGRFTLINLMFFDKQPGYYKLLVYSMTVNIWKSCTWTADKEINMEAILAVMNTT